MISQSLLNIVMLVEIGLLALAVVLFFTHGIWLYVSENRLARLSKIARLRGGSRAWNVLSSSALFATRAAVASNYGFGFWFS